jgi:chemotaxis protein CheX
MNTERIVEITVAASKEVFETMLGMEVTPGEPRLERSDLSPSGGVLACVGLAGAWAGTGSIACDANFACRISGQFLMTQYESVNEGVLDAIAEITNMIIGNVKTALEAELGPMGLSIPTVIYGRNFASRTTSPGSVVVVPFMCEGEEMRVQICLVAQRETVHSPRALAVEFCVPVI